MRNMTKRRRALMIQAQSEPIIPVEYRQVAWLQGTSEQTCNTGVLPVSNANNYTSIKGDVVMLNNTAQFGINSFWRQSNNLYEYGLDGGNTSFETYFGNLSSDTHGFSMSGTYPRDVHYEINKTNVKINNVTYNKTASYYSSSSPIIVGLTYYYSEEGDRSSSGVRFKKFSIYNNNTLVYDFIPCYRKSDGKAGFYKLTVADSTGVFLPSATGTDWIIGPVA